MMTHRRALGVVLLAITLFLAASAVSRVYAERAALLIHISDIVERIALPYRILQLSMEAPDAALRMPLRDLRPADVADTWGDPRPGGRTHQGVDMFADRGTPVFSATDGFVVRASEGDLGGIFVFVAGRGGVRYYYAHLDAIAAGIEPGAAVTTDTVLGFVGNTGNASGTPPHLHFGMYRRGPRNPYELLVAWP